MRLVKLELRESPFWFLSNSSGESIIILNENKQISDFVNVDALPNHMKKIINQSSSQFEINILDFNGSRVKTIEETSILNTEYSVNTEDEVLDDSDLPEIISITTRDDEEEKEDIKTPVLPTPEVIENAKILLERNGNTIKKSLKALKKTDDNLDFLHLCAKLEHNGQNRQGVISAIQQLVMEY
jgi:hypothetical protein